MRVVSFRIRIDLLASFVTFASFALRLLSDQLFAIDFAGSMNGIFTTVAPRSPSEVST